uniref:oxidoreductase n=1 Tax=Azospirillum argentinense TaxID=2970906 RepID=UPI0015869DB1|nr:oxidoreductase [Azospirillum argentinense]
MRFIATCLAVGMLLLGVANAAESGKTKDADPLSLVVSGPMASNAGVQSVRFDLAGLQALGTVEVATSTPWTDGIRKFRGVEVSRILDAAGARGGFVNAVAANDYRVRIPVEDFRRFGVIAAFEMDGVRLSPRDKGYLWIVYPRDRHPELMQKSYNERWIWQLKAIEVTD